jgi:cell division septum initiation protein DivIVA
MNKRDLKALLKAAEKDFHTLIRQLRAARARVKELEARIARGDA